MASGMGVRGTIGRCYGFFADYKDCTARLRHADPNDKETINEIATLCFLTRDDYFECLHGTKEQERLRVVLEHAEKTGKSTTAD